MTAIAALVGTLAHAAGTQPNPIQTENPQHGTDPSSWLQPAYPSAGVEGYASEVSVLPGEDVHLHVSTVEGYRYSVEIYRLGWYGGLGARHLQCIPDCGLDEPGHRYSRSTVDAKGVLRAGWPVTDTFSLPSTATSGYYYALLRVTSGGDDTSARGYVPFVVRDPPSRRSQILVQAPVNTWQAYNPWGGRSLYPFNSTDLAPAQRVSGAAGGCAGDGAAAHGDDSGAAARRSADPALRGLPPRGRRRVRAGRSGVVRICRTTGRACTLRRLRTGTYRFAAVAVDEWGQSAPVLSRKVVVRARRP